MGLFDGFPFKNRKQAEKERRQYEKMVFPLGVEVQREAACRVLAEIRQPKAADDQMLFAFLCAKEAYLRAENNEEEEEEVLDPRAAALAELKRQRWVQEETGRLILALIELEKNIPSIEEYPTTEAVRERANGYFLAE